MAESYGSMSLTLEERQKSRAKRGASWQPRKTLSRHTTFVALFSEVRFWLLILAIPVPQIQDQIVAGQGVYFVKVISTIEAMVTLFNAEQLPTSEFGFRRRGGAVVRLLRHGGTCLQPPSHHPPRLQGECKFHEWSTRQRIER